MTTIPEITAINNCHTLQPLMNLMPRSKFLSETKKAALDNDLSGAAILDDSLFMKSTYLACGCAPNCCTTLSIPREEPATGGNSLNVDRNSAAMVCAGTKVHI